MGAVFLASCVNRHNVGVMQLGGSFGLPSEALHAFGRQPYSSGEHLQRDAAVEGDLPRVVDNAHAAPAEHAQNFIARNNRPGCAAACRGCNRALG